MAYNKRTWLGRQGTGLNKFSIGGASPVTIVNQPDSVTQVGDALSAGNLNDLEDRIEDAFDETASQTEVSNLNNAITQLDHRVQNLEQAHGSYEVKPYKDGSITPSGKGNWAVVEGLRGVSRVDNNMVSDGTTEVVQDGAYTGWTSSYTVNGTKPITGRKYLCIFKAKVTAHVAVVKMRVTAGTDDVSADFSISSTGYQTFAWIYTGDASYNYNLRIVQLSGSTTVSGDSIYIKDVEMKDLNVYFGTSDLSFLGATDSAKLATIQTNYPHLLTPSEYGTRILDSSYSGVRAEGNLIDESSYGLISEISRYGLVADVDEGFFTLSGTAGQSYATGLYVNGNLTDIENVSGTFSRTFNISEPCKLMIWINSSTNYLSNVMLNRGMVANPYCAYMPPHTLSLTFQGKSAGSVYDSCEPNVEVNGVARKRTTERIGSVLIPDLPWDRGNNGGYWNEPKFYVKIPDMQTVGLEDILSIYTPTSEGTSTMPNMSIKAIASNNYVYIRDDRYNSVADFKTAMAGVPIYYPKATPVVTLSDPVIDNTLLTESGGRMATVQTGTIVDGSFDMGFITL